MYDYAVRKKLLVIYIQFMCIHLIVLFYSSTNIKGALRQQLHGQSCGWRRPKLVKSAACVTRLSLFNHNNASYLNIKSNLKPFIRQLNSFYIKAYIHDWHEQVMKR